MLLNLFATLFVIGGTFVNSLFGLYSGIVNLFCSVTALAVAFGYWELLDRFLATSMNLDGTYTGPLSLGLLFIVTLLTLRLLADNLLRGNVHVPMYVDWVGGGICGFLYSQIIVGVLVLSFLMLPWGGGNMMFYRIARHPDKEIDPDTNRARFVRSNLWLRSDDLAVGLFKVMSSGSLRGDTTLSQVYPDFAEWVFWTGNAVQHESRTAPLSDGKADGWDEKGIRVVAWWDERTGLSEEVARYRKDVPTRENQKPPYEPTALRARDGKKIIGMRLDLQTPASDADKDTTIHRFRPTNIRVVGDVAADGMTRPRHYSPAAIGGADINLGYNVRIVDPDNNFTLVARASTLIDAFFEVDENFTPRFVEYRRRARAPVTNKPAESGPTERLSADPNAPRVGAAAAGGAAQATTVTNTGTGRFIDAVVRANTGDTPKLPFTFQSGKLSSDLSVELKDGKLVSVAAGSRVTGFRRDLEALGQVTGPGVAEIAQPEGKRIFQVQAQVKRMQSLPGQAISFAAGVTNQYRAVDANGNSHDLAGYYAIVKKNGQDYIELFYTPDPGGSGFRGLVELDQETRRLLREQDDAVLGLIFVLPPGTCVRMIQSQGGRSEFDQPICVSGG